MLVASFLETITPLTGVPLFMPNKKGALGLHSAAAAGFNEVVKMLIARGTNVDIRTRVSQVFFPTVFFECAFMADFRTTTPLSTWQFSQEKPL